MQDDFRNCEEGQAFFCITRESLEELIHTAVKEAFSNYKHTCQFAVNGDDVRAANKLFDSLRELGDGDMNKGVELFRDQHRLLKRYLALSDRIAYTVIMSIVLSILSFVGLTFVIGLVERAKEVLK